MPVSSWPGIKQLREFFERRDPDPSQRITLTLDFAEMGTAERVTQMKVISQEFQQMCVVASAAYKKRLRGE